MESPKPKYSIAEVASNRLRAALNAQIRNRGEYNLDNVSAIWHVTSCKGVQLPNCRGGIFYPQGKTQSNYKIIVFVTDPQYNNWAESIGLDIISKWVNPYHKPLGPGVNTQPKNPIQKRTYEEVYDELWKLTADLAKIDHIALALNMGLSRARSFRNRMRVEQAKLRTKAKDRIEVGKKRVSIGS
jgi:hypothetical protein|tara:strand:+ start:70 stop:624 length:555 start_codon:yes stop_codon:yes gene_type:complete